MMNYSLFCYSLFYFILQYCYKIDIRNPNVPKVKGHNTSSSSSQARSSDTSAASNAVGQNRTVVMKSPDSDYMNSTPPSSGNEDKVMTGLRTKRLVEYDHCDIIGDQFWEENPDILCDDWMKPSVDSSSSSQGLDKTREQVPGLNCVLIDDINNVEVPYLKRRRTDSGDAQNEQVPNSAVDSGSGTVIYAEDSTNR